MSKPTLIVMAAGMGSRYGGLKQIDPVGPGGEKIVDYSVYDAVKAGFGKVVFVIKEDMKKIFRESIGKNIEKSIDTSYVFQKLDDIPTGFQVPEERVKPWGTGHAVLCSRHAVKTPFAVINADDFYGRSSFETICDFLKNAKDNACYEYCMVGFHLKNTLTEHGHVARGICSVDDSGYLSEIHERTRIEKHGDKIEYLEDGGKWIEIQENTIASMNMWGFTQSLFKELEKQFVAFMDQNHSNILKKEFFIPSAVDMLVSEKKARVRVLPTEEKWYGVTYQNDKQFVESSINDMVKHGVYPEKLWQ